MKNLALGISVVALGALWTAGCGGASSQQKQREALVHQTNSDTAAEQGRYGTAAEEQKKAQEAHHEAVMKAIDKQQPIPPQPQKGDTVPPPPAPQK
jgi:hypothetical protein